MTLDLLDRAGLPDHVQVEQHGEESCIPPDHVRWRGRIWEGVTW
jgi:hypothetical protein